VPHRNFLSAAAPSDAPEMRGTEVPSDIIYCIGDSHIHFFSGWDHIGPEYPKLYYGRLPYFKSFRLGAVLAYNLCTTGTTTKGREKLLEIVNSKIKPPAKILLSFGEIDCRAHLLKQKEIRKKPIEEIVAECVDRYLSVIMEITAMGFEVIVWNVVPSSLTDIQDDRYGTYGSCVERNAVSKLFNDSLGERCREHRIKFISIFSKLIDEQGLSKNEYYMDNIHISQKAMPLALEELKKHIPDFTFDVGKSRLLLETVKSLILNKMIDR
jgi:hypothetical protein